MNRFFCLLSALCMCGVSVSAREYHVSLTGSNANDGSIAAPLRTINEAARRAMPGDTVTVHEGTYRECIVPPRGGTSDRMRITYRAAPGERVVVSGSEPVSGWVKVQHDTWRVTLPNTFFGTFNPFDELIYGSWYNSDGRPNHTGEVLLNGQRLREIFSRDQILRPIDGQPRWYAEADGNGGPVLVEIEGGRPATGEKKNSMQASVEGGDQAICIAEADRWPFGYLKDGSVLHFDGVDFGAGTDTLFFQAATLAKGGIVEARLNDPSGELLGLSMVTNTGGWEAFAVFPIKMNRKLAGTNDICFVLRAPAVKQNGQTTIWAQFPNGIDPNKEEVEITVRPQVFYPDRAGVNYITISGFILENAATNWAPPSAEQPGLVGTRWSKGWIIENNTIRNSRCSGISLGRPTFGHAHHYQKLPPKIYPEPGGGQTLQQLIDYFDRASWNKEDVGFHIVRNNHIYECGQAGIVGCSGGAFSLIEGNEIHDICLNESFTGAVMGGIKRHFVCAAILRNNHIYRSIRGLWLDWGAQGVQVIGNLFHDNDQCEDLFVEVCHGPTLVANNIMLSRKAMTLSSQGIAAVHNLVCGGISGNPDIRETFFYEPHGTISAGKTVNRGGDFRWYNNLLLERASLGDWSNHELPIVYGANVFAAGAHAAADDHTAFADSLSDPAVKLVQKSDGWYLSMNVPAAWKGKIKCKTVTTSTLGKAVVPDQEFTNPDGSRLRVDRDYLGRKRRGNPSPGAFEIGTFGPQECRVWPKQE